MPELRFLSEGPHAGSRTSLLRDSKVAKVIRLSPRKASSRRGGSRSEALSPEDYRVLRHAKKLLDTPGLAGKIARRFGVTAEKGLHLLPPQWNDRVAEVVHKSLEAALKISLKTVTGESNGAAWERSHRLAVGAAGAIGGAFGLAGLALELPVSTVYIMRSVVYIARSEGEVLHSPETHLACLEVFALGGTGRPTDSAYFAIRGALARSITEAANHLALNGLTEHGAPAVLRFISQVATRFGVNVTHKLAAQAIPLAGAVGGAVVNSIFTSHFQNVARGHFIVRRLERVYSPGLICDEYDHLSM